MWSDETRVWSCDSHTLLDPTSTLGKTAMAECKHLYPVARMDPPRTSSISRMLALWVQALDGKPQYIVKNGPPILVFHRWKGTNLVIQPADDRLELCRVNYPYAAATLMLVPRRFFDLMVEMVEAKIPPFILWWSNFDRVYTMNSMDVCMGDVLERLFVSAGSSSYETRRKLAAIAGMASAEGIGYNYAIDLDLPIPEAWMDHVVAVGQQLIAKKESLAKVDGSTRATIVVKAATQIPWWRPAHGIFVRPRLLKDKVEDVLTDAKGVPTLDDKGEVQIRHSEKVTRLIRECAGCQTDESVTLCMCGCGSLYCEKCECELNCHKCEEKCTRTTRNYCRRCRKNYHNDCKCGCDFCVMCDASCTYDGLLNGVRCKKCQRVYCHREGGYATGRGSCWLCRASCVECLEKLGTDEARSSHMSKCTRCRIPTGCYHNYHLHNGTRYCSRCFIHQKLSEASIHAGSGVYANNTTYTYQMSGAQLSGIGPLGTIAMDIEQRISTV